MLDLTLKYTPREWILEEVTITQELRDLDACLSTEQESGLTSCGSDSEYARRRYEQTGSLDGLFFYDTEQIMMGCGRSHFGQMRLGRLISSWRGYTPGTLIFVIAKGVDEGKFTVGIEKK